MNSREQIKEVCQKLRCFRNPLLHEIAEDLEQAYGDLFGKGISEIINDVALQENLEADKIASASRDEHLVYCRYLVARRAISDYTLQQIANALNKADHSAIVHLLNYYHPPQKFTK